MRPACRPGAYRLLLHALLVLVAAFAGSVAGAGERWILVDTGAMTLSVLEGERTVAVFDNISIGQNGVTRAKRQGDNRTPLGTYRITHELENSRYYRFFTLNYPSLEDARRAHLAGRIDDVALDAIRSAHERGRQPPATTPLGGHIGIHGIGDGDLRIHEDFNWTNGCVALTDGQIDDLATYLAPGMTVVIH